MSTAVCSADWSIGLSADSCCLWHDESSVRRPECNARYKSYRNDLEFSFILNRIIPQFIPAPDASRLSLSVAGNDCDYLDDSSCGFDAKSSIAARSGSPMLQFGWTLLEN